MSETGHGAKERRSGARRLRGTLLRPATFIPLAILVIVVGACLAAGLITSAPPNTGDLTQSLQGPSGSHPLGTDELGRDILSRLLHGGLVSLGDALLVVVVTLAVAVPLGLLAGYLGRWFDRAVMTAVEIGMAIPVIILVLVVLSVFQDHFSIALIALALLLAPPMVRNIRGPVLAMRSELFVDASRVAGVPTSRIVARHVFRRVLGPILVQATLMCCMALQLTVALAYLGFGTTPPNPTWGSMVAEGAQLLSRDPRLLLISGGVIGVVILCLGVLGDVIRDATVGSWGRAEAAPAIKLKPAAAVRTEAAPAGTGGPAATTVPPATRDALLSVRDLTVSYRRSGQDVAVASRVSFDIAPGDAVGLVGESGCGKTSVARALLRMGGRITDGALTFDGRDVLALEGRELADYRGGSVGYVSQEPMTALDPTMRVGALLAEVVRRHEDGHPDRAAVHARVLELLEMVQLPDPARTARLFPHEMSGGMAQRVSIARALAGRPRILVADEPTTALDVTVQAGILELLRTLQAETGMALVLVSHNWGVVAQVCRRTIVMYAGQVVEEGPLDTLLTTPAHPYTKQLIACQPGRDTLSDADLPTIRGSVADPSTWTGTMGCRFAARCPYATAECELGTITLEPLDATHGSRCVHSVAVLEGTVEHAG
ncbi:dipeptide/oligopeptide/nickel ABC transporter permease/ATP-binding protein [Streptomyces sp. NPDC007901]|uniref:dipeptide/oligopeptide/nickel ABC transporter permease/ATP-binding protein n=1 Tax=Streptomyces sp. NPDC007901 TaxID=3364785 RepID=UPI0036E4621F